MKIAALEDAQSLGATSEERCPLPVIHIPFTVLPSAIRVLWSPSSELVITTVFEPLSCKIFIAFSKKTKRYSKSTLQNGLIISNSTIFAIFT